MKAFALTTLCLAAVLCASPQAEARNPETPFLWEHFGGDKYIKPAQLNDPRVVRAKLATAKQNAPKFGVSLQAAEQFEAMGKAILIDHVMPAGCGKTILPAGLHIGGMGTGDKPVFIPNVVVGPAMGQPGINNQAVMCYVVGAGRTSTQYFVIPKICYNVFYVVWINGECVYYVLA